MESLVAQEFSTTCDPSGATHSWRECSGHELFHPPECMRADATDSVNNVVVRAVALVIGAGDYVRVRGVGECVSGFRKGAFNTLRVDFEQTLQDSGGNVVLALV